MSWECECGISNRDDAPKCAGCGWTKEQLANWRQRSSEPGANLDSSATPAQSQVPAPGNAKRYAGFGLIAGLVLGYPISYYFQSSALRAKLSLGDYIAKASDIMGSADLRSAVVLGFVVAIAVCVAVGFFVGNSMDQKR